MRKIVKEGTLVKVKSDLVSGNSYGNNLFFNGSMEQYEGQEFKVINSSWDNIHNECRFFLEGAEDWTWNLEMIEEVGEENMRDLDRVCADCERELEEGEELVYLDHYGKYVCEDCLDDYVECSDCGDLVHRDDLTWVYNSYGDEIQVCDSCLENYRQCEECGDYHPYDDMYEEDYYYYCENCYENNPRHLICDYHNYDRGFEFYKGKDEVKPPFYIGRELEMENDYIDVDVVKYIKDELNGITSHDGSLNGEGAMEWVDHPRSMKNHYEVADTMRETFKKLVDSGYRSNDTDTCGLHFHVSRPYQVEINELKYSSNEEDIKKREELQEKQDRIIDRIILVMETYKEELIKFSRRKSTYWCKWLSDVVTTENGKITSLDFIKKNKHESYGHHRALNLENSDTIEFRIFKGTLNFDTYMASLELVNNITTLCSDLDLPVEKITWNKLTNGQYVSKYVEEKDIHTNHKVVDTSEIDRIWSIIKNKKRVKVFNKILKEFDKYYQYHVDKFDSIKNSEDWSKICETSGRLREYACYFKQVVDYKNNHEYDNLFYKINDMFNYNMYFDCDNEELQAIRNNINELIKDAR